MALTALDRFRRPKYTGENRCTPCTFVNVIIAIAIGAVVAGGMWWFLAAPLVGLLLAGSLFAVSLLAIYLRGYLVPGTPQLTKRYFPDWVLRRFDKLEEITPVDEAPDVEGLFLSAGVVEECPHEDDLCLTEAFASAWTERIEQRTSMDVSRGDLAELLSIDEADLSVEQFEDAFVANYEGRHIGQWESDAAFIADMAAESVLGDWVDGWTTIEPRERSGLLAGLRVFLDDCPSCGGSLDMGEGVVESCCRSIDVVTVECTTCERRLLETANPVSV